MNFPIILLNLILISGLISLVDILFWAPKRRAANATKMPMIVDYSRSFFPVLLVVFVIRSFVFQPFEVPTGSLEPSVIPTEFLFVNQFSYGIRLPIWGTKILSVGHPQRGDIAVFKWPVNTDIDFVKRVVGLPGDHISYINKVLTINGKVMTQTFVKPAVDIELNGGQLVRIPVEKYSENLDGVIHGIYRDPEHASENFYNVIVPPGEYFMMGDNRDDSEDSRWWGFVPEKDFVGKAEFILLSLPDDRQWPSKIDWARIGKSLP